VDTSFIFHPTTHRLPMPVCPRSLSLFTSYLLQQLHRVAPSWALPLSPPLRPSFLLSCSDSVVSIARGNRDSLPPFPILRCFSLFLLFFVFFLSTSILFSRSIRPHLSFILFALYSFSSPLFLFRFNRVSKIFRQLFRQVSRCFFPGTCSCYSPFSFRPYLYSNINKCEFNYEKPANEYDVATVSFFYLIVFDCRSIKVNIRWLS